MTFSCRRCGTCCTKIGGRFSKKEIELIERGFRNLERRGIRLLIDPKDMSVPLFPDEIEVMLGLAEEIGIDFRPRPKLVKDGEIIEWDLGYSRCPFYDEEKGCMIYSHRPLACRAFPVIKIVDHFELLDLCPEAMKFKGRDIEREFPQECIYAERFFERIEREKRRLLQEGAGAGIRTRATGLGSQRHNL